MFDSPQWGTALGILVTAFIVVGAIGILHAFVMSRPTIMPPTPDESQVRDALRERVKTHRYLGNNKDETK